MAKFSDVSAKRLFEEMMRWNQTDSTFDQEKTFLDLFNLQVERYPLESNEFGQCKKLQVI